jgi:glycosyltransferase involved in cell wall biosynthesis
MKKPLLWIENIRCSDIIQQMKWSLVVYHVSDRFEECPYTRNKDKLRERERVVTASSDLIVCVSQELFESKKDAHAVVKYLPHGVDFDKFKDAVRSEQVFPGLAACKRPVIGYFGTLTAENDIRLLEYCAAQLPHYTFVFAGAVTGGDYGTLMRMPNVVFLGRVPYEQIPLLCAGFDVCLLPWKVNKWIENCNPLKFFEYMASGRPMVSVPIREIEKYGHLVSIAGDHDAFCRRIQWELENDSEARSQQRLEIAGRHDWRAHVALMADWIDNALQHPVFKREGNLQKVS